MQDTSDKTQEEGSLAAGPDKGEQDGPKDGQPEIQEEQKDGSQVIDESNEMSNEEKEKLRKYLEGLMTKKFKKLPEETQNAVIALFDKKKLDQIGNWEKDAEKAEKIEEEMDEALRQRDHGERRKKEK